MNIRACPFCGHTGVELIAKSNVFGDVKYQVICYWCEAQGSLRREPEKAIKTWNNTCVIWDEEGHNNE